MNWVLLRGLGREKRHWEDFPQVLQDTGAADKVLLLDLPGAGERFKQAVPATLAECLAILRQEVAPDFTPCGLFGLSLGGMLAMHWAQSFPADVKGLVVANSSLAGIGRPWHRLRPSVLPLLWQIMRESDPFRRELLILSMVSKARQGDQGLAKKWAAYAEQRPMARKTIWQQLALGAKAKMSGRPKVKSLFLTSRGDRMVCPQSSESLASHFQGELARHPWAGHDLTLDDPKWCAAQVRAFADSL